MLVLWYVGVLVMVECEWDELGIVAERGRLLVVLVAPDGGRVDARSRPRLKVKRCRIRSALWESLRSMEVEKLLWWENMLISKRVWEVKCRLMDAEVDIEW